MKRKVIFLSMAVLVLLLSPQAWSGGQPEPEAGPGSVRFASTWQGDTEALRSVVENFTAKTGIEVKVNEVDGPTFSDQINAYLQGRPDDIYTWFGGYRMRYYAEQGLVQDLSDVWDEIGSSISQAFRDSSTGNDGKQYLIPFYNYPWVILYRQSVFKENGYEIPKTLDELMVLAEEMEKDGLVPFAFADQDGWPAQGWFDIINMRLNGYQFHVDLLAGKEKWTNQRVADVFETWKMFLPYYGDLAAALGRTWQNGANLMIKKQAGMLFFGTFAGTVATDPDDHEDLDFFAFPVFSNQFDDERGIDAPINGFLVGARSPTLDENMEAVKAFAAYLGSAEAQSIFLAENPNFVAASNKVDTSQYVRLQRKAAEIIAESGAIAQFLDRDTDPAFAGQMSAFLQDWLVDPDQDMDPFLQRIQTFWDSLGIK